MAGRNPWIFFGQQRIENGKSPGRGGRGWTICRRAPSDVHTVLAEVGDRVDVRAVLRRGAGLEVQMRTGDVAGRAGQADLLAGSDLLAHRDADGRQVPVLGVR